MFSNNFKWVFFVILIALFGVLVKFDPMNWWGTYDVDQSMMAIIITRPTKAIIKLPEGTQYTISDKATLSWEARKVGGMHTGTLNITDGTVVVASGNIVWAQFNIDMNSIINSDIPAGDAMNTKLVGELKEFFNVKKYPTATFFLTNYASGVAQWDLTLNGITKTIQFPAVIVVEGQKVTIKASFFIQRSQWNLTKWEGMVQEELKISFDLTASTTQVVKVNVFTGSVDTWLTITGNVVTGAIVKGSTMTGSSSGSTEDDIINAVSY